MKKIWKKKNHPPPPLGKRQFDQQGALTAPLGCREAAPAGRRGERLLIAASLDFGFGRLRFGR